MVVPLPAIGSRNVSPPKSPNQVYKKRNNSLSSPKEARKFAELEKLLKKSRNMFGGRINSANSIDSYARPSPYLGSA